MGCRKIVGHVVVTTCLRFGEFRKRNDRAETGRKFEICLTFLVRILPYTFLSGRYCRLSGERTISTDCDVYPVCGQRAYFLVRCTSDQYCRKFVVIIFSFSFFFFLSANCRATIPVKKTNYITCVLFS